ncbi:MAG TPA: aminomethyl transferase family protein [Pseudolysinimonas sp.]|nr:aminomethyl transferase family protein [Pseudolysinimonas sp.]
MSGNLPDLSDTTLEKLGASGATLAELLEANPNPVRALRSIPYTRPTAPSPLVLEYSNWTLEQASWRESVSLLHQSEHMSTVFITGPDAHAFLSRLAVNSFAKFTPGRAKQFIPTNGEGYMLGDGILVYMEEESFQLIIDPAVALWVEFQAEIGTDNVKVVSDHPRHWYYPLREKDPVLYRYEIQGPDAMKVMEVALGEPAPDTKFFHLTQITIAGRTVNALRHGMAGQPGFELFGPYADGEAVREALLEAGKPFGITPIGSIAYMSSNLESGWLTIELPAVFTGESTKAYREWLPAATVGVIGGSFDSENIEDYYVTPFDLGYGPFIDFEHEFIGREALLALRDKPHREKVTLIWDEDDFASLFHDLISPDTGLPPQRRALHDTSYTVKQYDAVQSNGKTVGIAVQSAYVAPDRRFISLALVDPEFAEPGTELTFLWGDSTTIPRPEIEPHRQVSVRVTVAPTPFSAFARENYRK